MMSITNRSRILAFVLAVAMVLSLVPVMAAAESGKEYVGYADITYPEKAGENYKVSTVYYDAEGNPTAGEVAVKIMHEDAEGVEELFYYNIINVAADGKISVDVAFDADDDEGRYNVEFITGNINTSKNKAYFHHYADADDIEAALEADLKGKAVDFSSVELQQKLRTLNGLAVYNKYVVNDENEEIKPAFYEKVQKQVEALDFTYESDSAFVKKLEEETVIALFDLVTKKDIDNFKAYLYDEDILNVIINSDVSKDFNKAAKTYLDIDKDDKSYQTTLTINDLTKSDSVYGEFDTMTAIAEKLLASFNATLPKEEEKGGEKDTVTNDNSGFGGNTKPSNPTNPVLHVSAVFTDLDANYWWVLNPLQVLYTNGYINGRTATTFAPGENITRAEFLKILLLELNMVDAKATVSFSDVDVNDWFYPYVASGANKGIVKGRSETEFAPNAQITREEICIMTMRAVRALNIDLGSNVATGTFTDEAEIASYAVEDVHALKAAGIVSGRDTGAFDPKANATRAEAVKILFGVYDKQ